MAKWNKQNTLINSNNNLTGQLKTSTINEYYQIGADFVCFEPWYNTPDYVNSTKEFKEKKDIVELEPGKEFNISFSVEFY